MQNNAYTKSLNWNFNATGLLITFIIFINWIAFDFYKLQWLVPVSFSGVQSLDYLSTGGR